MEAALNSELPGIRFAWEKLLSFVEDHALKSVTELIHKLPILKNVTFSREVILFTTTTTIAMVVIPMIFFYCYGLVLYFVDMLTSEYFKTEYKVQPKIRISNTQYWDGLKVSLFNWIFLGFPYLGYLSYYMASSLSGTTFFNTFPSWLTFGRDLIVFIALEEVMFYFSHRLLHYGKLYVWIHKFHHTYTAPFGIAAIYAHPIEHMLSNVIPVSMGPLVMQSHPMMGMIWGVIALFNTMTVHSGYDFNRICFLMPPPYFHDWHHEKFNENFGATQVLDYVFNTNKNFLIMMKELKNKRQLKKD